MYFLDQSKLHLYALLRIVTGFLFLWHGTQKFIDFPKPGPEQINTLLTMDGGIEVIGDILVMIGLFTRPAAFISSGTMAVAYWLFHAPESNPYPGEGAYTQVFCTECGSGLPFLNEAATGLFIPAGSVDTELKIAITKNIFWADRSNWIEAGMNAKKCCGFPD